MFSMRKASVVARAVPIASPTAGGREPAAQAGALDRLFQRLLDLVLRFIQ